MERVDGKRPSDEELYAALQHFYVFRPDLRTRGSIDGSLSDALIRKVGFDRVSDLNNALRKFFEGKNRTGAEFSKDEILPIIDSYRMPRDVAHKTVKAEDLHIVDEKTYLEKLVGINPETWEARIDKMLFATVNADSVVETAVCAVAAKELAEVLYTVPKMSLAEQFKWNPFAVRLSHKFVNSGLGTWSNVGQRLGMMMEAAPDAFLARLKELVRDEATELSADGGLARGLYVNVLYGLAEVLASNYHAMPVFDLVIKMADAERRKGMYGPAHSFLEYHLSEDHSDARLQVTDRLALLDHVFSVNDEMGWTILVNLLPTIRTVRLSYACPSLLTGYSITKNGIVVPAPHAKLSEADLDDLSHAIVSRAIGRARKNALRLSKLVTMLDLSSKTLFDATTAIVAEEWEKFGDDAQQEIISAIREIWPSCVSSTFYRDECEYRTTTLINLLGRIFGKDELDIGKILFNADSYSCPENVKESRRRSVGALYSSGGIDGVLDCARSVRFSCGVGESLYDAVAARATDAVMKILKGESGEREKDFAASYLCHCFRHERSEDGRIEDDWTWAYGVYKKIPDEKERGVFFATLPFSSSVWSHAERILSKGAKDVYFRNLRIAMPHDKIYAGVDFVIRGLLSVGRPLDAIRLCAYIGDGVCYDIHLLADAFDALRIDDYPSKTWHETSHSLDVAIIRLQNSAAVERRRISSIEIRLYDKLFSGIYQKARPNATYELITTSASDFVELLKCGNASAKKVINNCPNVPGAGSCGFDEILCLTWIKQVFELASSVQDLQMAAVKFIAKFLYRMVLEDESFVGFQNLCAYIESDEGEVLRTQIKLLNLDGKEAGLNLLLADFEAHKLGEGRIARLCHELTQAGYSRFAAALSLID